MIKKKNEYVEIDLFSIFIWLWEKKFTLTIFGIIFGLIGFVYSNLQSKTYETYAVIDVAKASSYNLEKNNINYVEKSALSNLLSIKSFELFINQIDVNKNYNLDKDKIKQTNLHSNIRYNRIDKLNEFYKITFAFNEPLDGKNFLIDFVNFVNTNTPSNDNDKAILDEWLKHLEFQLQIAEKLETDNLNFDNKYYSDFIFSELSVFGKQKLIDLINLTKKRIKYLDKRNDQFTVIRFGTAPKMTSLTDKHYFVIFFLFGIFLTPSIYVVKYFYVRNRKNFHKSKKK